MSKWTKNSYFEFGWHSIYVIPYFLVMFEFYKRLHQFNKWRETPRPNKSPEHERLRQLAGMKNNSTQSHNE